MNIDLTYIKKIAQGDEEFVVDLVHAFVKDCKESAKKFEQGKEDLDNEKLGQLAHKCKSSFKNFGLYDFAETLHAIEVGVKENENVFSNVEKIIAILEVVINECNQYLAEKQIP